MLNKENHPYWSTATINEFILNPLLGFGAFLISDNPSAINFLNQGFTVATQLPWEVFFMGKSAQFPSYLREFLNFFFGSPTLLCPSFTDLSLASQYVVRISVSMVRVYSRYCNPYLNWHLLLHNLMAFFTLLIHLCLLVKIKKCTSPTEY